MNRSDSLREAVALSPDNAPLLILFGEACLEDLLPDDAAAAFRTALELDASNQQAKLGLARALHQTGKTSEAAVRLEALVAEAPGNSAAWFQLARIALVEDSRRRAIECYRKAVELGAPQDVGLEQEMYRGGAGSTHGDGKGGDDLPGTPSDLAKGKVTSEGWELEGDESGGRPTDLGGFAGLGGADPDMERPAITFNDVGGMEQVKEEIRMKIIYPLKNPDLFAAYGKKAGGGVLLYGPPGCGKTLISRATAGEISASFLAIGLHQILDLYIGESEKNLHGLFDTARQNTPAILFFDEVDALAADRRDMRKSAGRTLINQFLAEMDGTASANDGVLVLGATNAPWHIDPAFRRPGRFDRILFVPPPDDAARASVIEILARGKPITDLDIPALVKKTRDFSGADLKAVFDQAIERGLAKAMKSGQIQPLGTRDLLEAAADIKPSTRAWFESAKNYALYSNQGGFYNDVLAYLGIKH
ncbi:MAG: AAA family ATPase [Verrucomicrobiales bacterium]